MPKSQVKIYQREIKILTEILKLCHPEKMILFGSAASGTTNKDSDIDICIIKKFKNSKLDEKKKIFDLLWRKDFSYLFDPDIQLFHPDKFEKELRRGDPFLEKINKGKIVYEK